MKTIEKIKKAIKKHKSFLVTSHVSPEGDSLGSQLAMANLLSQMGKDFVIVDSDPIPARYRFLPNVSLIKSTRKKIGKKDAAIVLDCPNLTRVGKVEKMVRKCRHIINIDHHVSNSMYGNINWVEKDASSVGEMMYKLFKATDCDISKKTALYLYIAILTDTGSFNYGNTSSATHEIVGELLGYGLEPFNISQNIYENKTLGEIRLLGKVLSSLKVTPNGKIAYITVTKSLLEKTGSKPSSCENFVNFARSVRDVDVAIFFREDIKKKNTFHASFRSTNRADVNAIASYFGGGGHKNASGCVLKGSYVDIKKKVLLKANHEIRKKG